MFCVYLYGFSALTLIAEWTPRLVTFVFSTFFLALGSFIDHLQGVATLGTFHGLAAVSISTFLIGFGRCNKKVEHVICIFNRVTCCELCSPWISCLSCILRFFNLFYHYVLQPQGAWPFDWSAADRRWIVELTSLNAEIWLINGCEALPQSWLVTILQMHELVELTQYNFQRLLHFDITGLFYQG